MHEIDEGLGPDDIDMTDEIQLYADQRIDVGNGVGFHYSDEG